MSQEEYFVFIFLKEKKEGEGKRKMKFTSSTFVHGVTNGEQCLRYYK